MQITPFLQFNFLGETLLLTSKPLLKKVLGLVAECWPSLQSHSGTTIAPCQQHRLFPTNEGWQHLRLLEFRCLRESHLGYEFELTLESGTVSSSTPEWLDLQTQNSYSKVALWLTKQQLTGCQSVYFQNWQVPLCQALASVELHNNTPVIPSQISEWLAQQGLMPRGRFQILNRRQDGNKQTLYCRTTDCLSRACYHWLQQQAIRFQLIYVRSH